MYFNWEKVLTALPYLIKRKVKEGFFELKRVGVLIDRTEKRGFTGILYGVPLLQKERN